MNNFSDKEIVAEYERIELLEGGIENADPLAVRNQVAKSLGVSDDRIRSALIEAWNWMGTG